jgi:DNA-binding MarR family transcriptional regulator
MAFAPLDPILHNQLRLAIISLLLTVEEADFTYLLEKTGATRGNVSVQVTKLKHAGYINVQKGFKDNYSHTSCSITSVGLKAFETYVKAIKGYLGK